MMRMLLALLLVLLACGQALAKEAAPLATDEAVEKRLVAISEELRCLVCQNESLAGSHADLAYDLRNQIRGMIHDGKSDDEIMRFMTDRYGDFVRYKPPLKGTTLLLWFGPFLLMAAGIAGLLFALRRRAASVAASELATEDARRAEALLASDEETRE